MALGIPFSTEPGLVDRAAAAFPSLTEVCREAPESLGPAMPAMGRAVTSTTTGLRNTDRLLAGQSRSSVWPRADVCRIGVEIYADVRPRSLTRSLAARSDGPAYLFVLISASSSLVDWS